MIITALLLLAADPAVNCDEPQTQADMNICAAQEFRVADAELNREWKITMAHMKEMDHHIDADDPEPNYSTALLEAQRAWIKYRDAHCRSYSYYARGGSMESMLYGSCRADLTEQRIKQLKFLRSQ